MVPCEVLEHIVDSALQWLAFLEQQLRNIEIDEKIANTDPYEIK